MGRNPPRGSTAPDRSLNRTAPDRQLLGRQAEDLAAQLLQSRGLTILLRNYRRRRGEIDIVALEGEVLVIVEVRMRSTRRYGGAAASLDARKWRRIAGATRQLLQQRPELRHRRLRFDAVLVESKGESATCEWIRHACILDG